MSEWVGPVISCHEISKFYAVGDGLFALRDVDLEVEKGQFVVLMGPSGWGKSTLLNILGGIDRPSHSEVILKGRKFSRLSEDDLAIMRRTRNRHGVSVLQPFARAYRCREYRFPYAVSGVYR